MIDMTIEQCFINIGTGRYAGNYMIVRVYKDI